MTDPESQADKQDADEYETSLQNLVIPVPPPANDPESQADKADADEFENSG